MSKFNSATSVQHTFKQGVTTLFARGVVTDTSGTIAAVTADGASKALYTIDGSATGEVTVSWEVGSVQFLGSPVVTISTANSASTDLYVWKSTQLSGNANGIPDNPQGEFNSFNLNGTVVSGLHGQVYQVSGSGISGSVPTATLPPSGSYLRVTAWLTDSPVF